MFINPMWCSETERIGKQRCTPLGYALHVVSDLLGLVALVLLFGVGIYLVNRGFAGTFRASLVGLLAIPFVVAIIGSILFHVSWTLAHRRGFRYDYDANEASWLELGEMRTYKYPDRA